MKPLPVNQLRRIIFQLFFLTGLTASFLPCHAFRTFQGPTTRTTTTKTRRSSSLAYPLRLTTITNVNNDRLLPDRVYDTIRQGHIAVVPHFLSPRQVVALRSDAQDLHSQNQFSTDALSAYGSSSSSSRSNKKALFDPSRDRAVLKLGKWKDTGLGTWETRRRLGNRMAALRSELASQLQRPGLDAGEAVTKFGPGSTEISYTRFGPGAFLKRHVDEHHEELKGVAGWAQPTRRSISWLVYLNQDWNGKRDGGQLRCFQRANPTVATRSVLGARPNGDLQVAWLRATPLDPIERPVYLDGRRANHKCTMYIVDDATGRPLYISKDFETNPIFYMAGSETLVKRLLVDRHDLADRLRLVEPPKSRLGDLLSKSADYVGQGLDPADDEVLADVDPIGGTLVLFDSVTLPHEVLACRGRDRFSCSGWFHEDQQPAKLMA